MADEQTDNLYLHNPERRSRRRSLSRTLLASSTFGAIIMLACAVIALVIANSGAFPAYEEILNFEVGFSFTGFGLEDFFVGLTVEEWINDVFMTIFFFCVGLEIKHEIFVGELRNIRKALLPILAACGGVLVPIIIYSCFNLGSEYASGFGIPMATDIAFAIGVLSLVGKGVPKGLTVFLQTLAIADDIMAILVIAIFYGQSPDFLWLLGALVVALILLLLNRLHVYALFPYIVGGIVLWVCVFYGGIEATIAGVILAFTIPMKSQINPRVFGRWTIAKVLEARDRYTPDKPVVAQEEYTETVRGISVVSRHVQPTLSRMLHAFDPWSTFLILPLFAFFNAGVRIVDTDFLSVITSPVTLGVFFGLFCGKPIGITLASFICIKTKLSPIPTGCTWRHMVGAGCLGGVGFTMAIYVANLSFAGADAATMTSMAKVAILAASLVSGIVGVLILRSAIKHEGDYESTLSQTQLQHDEEIEADIEELSGLSKSPEADEVDEEEEYLSLTGHLGAVSDDELIEAFMDAAKDPDAAYRSTDEEEDAPPED